MRVNINLVFVAYLANAVISAEDINSQSSTKNPLFFWTTTKDPFFPTSSDNSSKSFLADPYARDFAVIRHQPHYVDKSLLIEAVLNDSQRLLLTAPRHSGKSINVYMLKRFFEILEDEEAQRANRELFKGLEIEKNESIVDEHFGKHPVIFLDFTPSRPIQSDMEALSLLHGAVTTAYDTHGYLRFSPEVFIWNKLQNPNWLPNCKYRPIEDTAFHIADALDDLARYLSTYFKKKAFVLIDDYGRLWSEGVTSINDSDELERIVTLYQKSIKEFLRFNQNIDRVILTGISDPQTTEFCESNDIVCYNSLEDSKFSKFYGNYSSNTPK